MYVCVIKTEFIISQSHVVFFFFFFFFVVVVVVVIVVFLLLFFIIKPRLFCDITTSRFFVISQNQA